MNLPYVTTQSVQGPEQLLAIRDLYNNSICLSNNGGWREYQEKKPHQPNHRACSFSLRLWLHWPN